MEGWDSTTGKADGGTGGSEHREAEGHLMPVIACNMDSSEIFESRVEESVEAGELGKSEMGLMAHSNFLTKKAYLTEGVVDHDNGNGPVASLNSGKALGFLMNTTALSTSDSGKAQGIEEEVTCLMIARFSRRFTIISRYQLRNIDVGFDLKNMKLWLKVQSERLPYVFNKYDLI
ncbi:hypothetical protein RHGRI_006584 [Rhododendron griersonianum]|uniref:Uncharacterized protein n=1 Tax=Rhododendron griersonianum TaxID=479676 RepID=A0AAV6KTU5_9ERIC|nr:hypothetical protein RHGRI_006584 [Rhododendron griersonianum]